MVVHVAETGPCLVKVKEASLFHSPVNIGAGMLCRRALEKKLGRYGPDAGEYRFSSEKEKASVIRFLLSRGFGIELIMRVINDHCSRDPEQEPEC